MSRLRYVFLLLAPLLLVALVACGAGPQSAAPSEPAAAGLTTK